MYGFVLLGTRGSGLGTRKIKSLALSFCCCESRVPSPESRIFPSPEFRLFQHQQLPMQFAPFAHAQIGKKARAAPVAQFRLGEILVRECVRVPQIQHADEVRLGVDELRMRGIRSGARIGRPFARVLDAQEGDQDQQLMLDAKTLRLDQHARQGDIDRQRGHLPANFGQLILRSAAMDGRFLIFRGNG